jgi:hypothetical protein
VVREEVADRARRIPPPRPMPIEERYPFGDSSASSRRASAT